MMDHVSGFGQSAAIMSGLKTLSIAEPTMAKAYCTLNIIDEYSRECLAIRLDRKLNSGNVIDVLSDLFILRGIPAFIRSDNSPEFAAQAVQDWIKQSAQRQLTSNLDHLGIMDIVKASMPGSGMSS